MENKLNTLVSNKIPIKLKGFHKAFLISVYLLNDKVAHNNDGSIEFWYFLYIIDQIIILWNEICPYYWREA